MAGNARSAGSEGSVGALAVQDRIGETSAVGSFASAIAGVGRRVCFRAMAACCAMAAAARAAPAPAGSPRSSRRGGEAPRAPAHVPELRPRDLLAAPAAVAVAPHLRARDRGLVRGQAPVRGLEVARRDVELRL